jgi:hypothetical protein
VSGYTSPNDTNTCIFMSRWNTNISTTMTSTTSTNTLRLILPANRILTGTDIRGLRIATRTTPISIINTSTERACQPCEYLLSASEIAPLNRKGQLHDCSVKRSTASQAISFATLALWNHEDTGRVLRGVDVNRYTVRVTHDTSARSYCSVAAGCLCAIW